MHQMLKSLASYNCSDTMFTIDQLRNKNDSFGIAESDGDYFGQLSKDDSKSGIGVKFFSNGDTYEGYFLENNFNGQGIYRTVYGDVYQGKFQNGQRNGFGALSLATGACFEGEWQNDLRHGRGFWQDGKGNNYIGDWKFDEADGNGILICQDGKFSTKLGSRYEGEMKNSLRHGKGIEKLAYGDCYIGDFVNGCFEGEGEYKWANGSLYKGQFKIGMRHGFGVWKKRATDSNEVYEGSFINDKRDGLGFVHYDNGNYFRGYFTQGIREGYGEMYWLSEKVVYRGLWANDKQEGLGELRFDDKNTAYLGYFIKGVLTELLNVMENRDLIEKLDEYQRQMQNDFKHNHNSKGTERGAKIAKILGDTLKSIYKRKNSPKKQEYYHSQPEGIEDDISISNYSRSRRSSVELERLPKIPQNFRDKELYSANTGVSQSKIYNASYISREDTPYSRYNGALKTRIPSAMGLQPKLKRNGSSGRKIWKPSGKFHGYIF